MLALLVVPQPDVRIFRGGRAQRVGRMQRDLGDAGSVPRKHALFWLAGQPVSHLLLTEHLVEALALLAHCVLL